MKNKEGSVTEYYAIHRNFTFCIIYFFAPERHTATKPTSWFSINLTMAPRLSNIQKQILIQQGCQEREKESKVNAHEGQVRQYSKSTRVLHCLWLEHDWLPVWGLPYDFRSNEGKRQVYEGKTYFGITDEIWKTAEKIINGSKEFPIFQALLEGTHSASLDKNHTFWYGLWLSVKTYQDNITQQIGQKEAPEEPIQDCQRRHNFQMRRTRCWLTLHGYPLIEYLT